MTDPELVEKKLAEIETYVRQLRTLTNHELFTLLEGAGWLPAALSARLRDMAGFRNVLVHGYSQVDLAVIEEILRDRLGDLTEFAAAVRRRLPTSS